MVGLKTPWAVPINRRLTYASHGRLRAVAISEIAQKGRVQWVAAYRAPKGFFWAQVPGDLRSQGWRLTLVRPAQDWIGYDVYRLTRTQ